MRVPTPKRTTSAQENPSTQSDLAGATPWAERAPNRPDVSAPKTSLIESIRDSFDSQVPRNLLNIPYRISLLAVALLMILLPLLYVTVILGSGYGVYWYCTEVFPGLMKRLPIGRAAVLGMMAYVAPIIGGCIMIVFMVKPIFFTLVPERAMRRRSISRAAEPVLFELVELICKATRSPQPKRIDISYDVNASASLRNGFWSLFRRDLVLTIGAPLIAGMNTRQLVGVLAHEFGHFAQGGGMKSIYVIRMINLWFVRVVHQRDRLDYMLDEAISDSDWRISLILGLGKLFVFLSRFVLHLFLIVAHAVSCLMMQQMEFDADRYEAYVSGSECFAQTSKRLAALGVGDRMAMSLVTRTLQSDGLLGDIPNVIAKCADSASSQEIKKLQQAMDEQTGGFFSTHPSDRLRIEAAKKHKADGIFQLERPARDLFKNYQAICDGATVDFYRNELRVMVRPDQLVDTATALSDD